MANTIKMKYSTVAGKVPAASALVPRELAINTTDGKVYTKKENGDVVCVGSNDLSDYNNDMWEVTSTNPTSGSGYPTGYVWYVV